MTEPLISLIACIGKDTRAIGIDNKLLWNIKNDLKRFKKITSGHPIIMGRKTFESIGQPLPNRLNIIITRQEKLNIPSGKRVLIVNSIEKALEQAKEQEKNEIFIIGGQEIYKQTIKKADKLYLTLVDDNKIGDSFFPPYDNFRKIEEESHQKDNLKYSFTIWKA